MSKLNAGQTLTAEAYNRSGFTSKLATGQLLTTDNQIDPSTGTLKLKASFPNTDNALFPNQFVNIKLLVDTKKDVILVPVAAIQHGNQGTFIYVVDTDNNTVSMKTVVVGTTALDGSNAEIKAVFRKETSWSPTVSTSFKTAARSSSRNPAPRAITPPPTRRPPLRPQHRQWRLGRFRTKPMSPSRTFILRPIATTLFMAAILLAGFVGYQQLPISALPEVDYPTMQIVTFYPGASPEVMASSVTAPLERQFGQVPGLQQMTSTSSDGSSVITLQFSLSLNIDIAEQEVQQAINASGTYLPADLPNPPIYSKTNPADAPIMTLALTSQTLPCPRSRT